MTNDSKYSNTVDVAYIPFQDVMELCSGGKIVFLL